MPTRDVEQALNRIEALLGSGQARAAEHAARALLLNAADDPQLHVLLAHALRAQSRLAEAREALDHVLVRHPGLVSARMLDVDLLHASGRQQACVETLQALEAEAARHPPRLLQDVAQRYTVLGMHAEAERCQRASRQREPGNAAIIYNHATALIALGKLNEAEAALDRVIALKPADSDAWYNRSTLRRQTAASNHITELQARLEATAPKAPARVALGYALAKEYEDLGEHAISRHGAGHENGAARDFGHAVTRLRQPLDGEFEAPQTSLLHGVVGQLGAQAIDEALEAGSLLVVDVHELDAHARWRVGLFGLGRGAGPAHDAGAGGEPVQRGGAGDGQLPHVRGAS